MKALQFLVLFCFLTTSGWQVYAQTVETAEPTEKTEPTVQKTAGVETAVVQETAKDQFAEKYRIGYQDTLEILVAKHPEMSVLINVGTDGTIMLPRIDRPVKAVCKTERELKEDLQMLYKSYLKNPYVNVRVAEQLSQPIGVTGAVDKPGAFNLKRRMRLLEALSLAGGPNVEFAGAKIVVARLGNSTACSENSPTAPNDDTVQFFEYKLADVQKGTINPYVQPGDIVDVRIAEEAYVIGDVGEAKKISLRETKTLSQAIAEAGGITGEAKASRVRIQRQEANSPLRTETIYDLNEIRARKIADPILQANDIVDVPKDGFKQVRNGVLKAISGGLSGLFLRL